MRNRIPFVEQATMTTPFGGAPRQQPPALHCVERTAARHEPLRMKWVVDTDEQGVGRLGVRWTVAPPPKSAKAKRPRLISSVRRACGSTAKPRARVAIP